MSNDLLYNDWRSVTEVLGEERTLKLIENGTSLDVAKRMAEQVREFRGLNKLF